MKYAIENGIVNPNDIQHKIEMKQREKYLELHNHKIWKNEKSGKWFTYLDDDSKRGYSLKVRSSKKEVENLVVDYYKKKEEDPYIESVFYMWIDQKLEYGEISIQTYNRYINDFKRFFTPECLLYGKRMRLITENELESFIKTTIKKFSLTAKSYANLRTLIRGMFKFAKRQHYTDISITTFFGDLELAKKSFKKKVICKEHEVFSEEEVKLITGYLDSVYAIRELGILLAFETGMRVGELSGLKKEDILEKVIHVQRTEITYVDPKTEKRVCEVYDFPKSEAGDRYLIIPDSAQNTIKKILELNPNGKYLFMENGRRIRANAFNRKLTRVCDILHIPHRSMHKIRKTYGTTLIDQNVNESLVAEQMGHKDISTTKKYYYFCNKNKEDKEKQINNALLC